MKIISHVMRNVNEFNIPAGTTRVGVLIVSRREVDKWKVSHSQSDINTFYCNQGGGINDIFKPAK